MNLVYELYNDKKHGHAYTHTTPPYPVGEPESKKIGFVAPILIFPSADISKTIKINLNVIQPMS